jgi:CRP/FNR family transcriptional regulator
MNLNCFSFYNHLEPSALEFLQKHLKTIQIPKGNILFFQGDICENILFLTNGKVRLYIQSDNADAITLYTLGAGEQCIINTASTISETQAIGSALTVTDIEGYLLDTLSVKELAHSSHVYQNFLFSIYTLRMGDLAKLINDIKFKHLDNRILEWLKSQKQEIIHTTHEEIANELGSSRVVISRLLKELENQKKIKLTRGAIELIK